MASSFTPATLKRPHKPGQVDCLRSGCIKAWGRQSTGHTSVRTALLFLANVLPFCREPFLTWVLQTTDNIPPCKAKTKASMGHHLRLHVPLNEHELHLVIPDLERQKVSSSYILQKKDFQLPLNSVTLKRWENVFIRGSYWLCCYCRERLHRETNEVLKGTLGITLEKKQMWKFQSHQESHQLFTLASVETLQLTLLEWDKYSQFCFDLWSAWLSNPGTMVTFKRGRDKIIFIPVF